MSLISTRAKLANKIGAMFGGKRDFYQELGYADEVTYEAALDKYKRQGITSRIVNAYPDAVWSRPPTFVGNPELDKAINGEYDPDGNIIKDGLTQKLSFYHFINRAEKLAGLGKFAILFLGFDDVRNVDQLKTPVKKKKMGRPKKDGTSSGTELIYLQAYGFGNIDIEEYTKDPSDPNFALPEIYTVNVDTGQPVTSSKVQIHHSRIVHIVDGQLDSELEGFPIIERVYNDLQDIMKIAGGSAEATWLASYKGLQFDIDKDMQFTEEQRAEIVEEIDKYAHGFQRFIRTRGININDLGADQVTAEPAFNIAMSMLSTTTGIPQRIFIGSEQGKLASEQDRSNWAGRIVERRELHSEPKILRPLVSKLQWAGSLPEGSYEVDWPDPFQLSPLERGQTSAQQARAATNIARTIKEVPDLLKAHEARSIIFGRGELKPRLSTEEKEGDDTIEVPDDDKKTEPVSDKKSDKTKEDDGDGEEEPDKASKTDKKKVKKPTTK